jgi:formate-dependent nitrite reductase cytochrome c552 subunit
MGHFRIKPCRFSADAAAQSATTSLILLAAALAAIALLARAAQADSADVGAAYRPGAPKFIGSVYCYACHQELALEFARTKMGELFLAKPRNDLERKGCEGCHGPGSAHAESGGGLGVGGLVEFRIDRGQPIKRANQACLECHDEAFWHGETHGLRRMACFDCHIVMVRMSPAFQLAPAAAGQSWNSARTWRDAALLGLLAGIAFGGWRRLRPRSRRKG